MFYLVAKIHVVFHFRSVGVIFCFMSSLKSASYRRYYNGYCFTLHQWFKNNRISYTGRLCIVFAIQIRMKSRINKLQPTNI